MRAAWPGTVVEEGNLTVQISALRRILDAGTQGESCIQTVSGRGYRFVPRVTRRGGCFACRDISTSCRAGPTEPPSGKPASPTRAWVSRRQRHADASLDGRVHQRRRRRSAGGPFRRPRWMPHEQAPPRPAAYSPQDRRQSVMVLPFENSSGDATLDNIAAAITRDVQDNIAEDSTIPLVPAGTASAYRGKRSTCMRLGATTTCISRSRATRAGRTGA